MASTNRVILFMLVFWSAIPCVAQLPARRINYPDRFRLDLPKSLMRPKIIRAVSEILPQTIDELKDRDFCTEGKAAYYVRLVMDSLSVNDAQTTPPVEIGSIPHYTFSFNYSFYAALMITDSLEKPVSLLQLVPLDEVMNFSKQFTLQPQNVIYRYQPVYDNRGRVVGRRLVEDAPAVNNFVPQISPFTFLTDDFLLKICEQKIVEIRKWLEKINPD